MTASAGRNLGFTWGGVSILGVREKKVELNGEAIDITSGEDSGKRTLMSLSGQDEVNFSVSGVSKDRSFRDDWFGGNRMKSLIVTWPDGSTATGNFFMGSYAEAAPYKDAITFDASFQSSGAVTYVPGA